jgi:hypothetical protein
VVRISAVLAQRLSRLIIDVDKDWAGRRITNLAGISSSGDLIISPPPGMSVFIGNNDGLRGLWITAEGEASSAAPIKNSGVLTLAGRYWTGSAPSYFRFILQTILESAAPYGRLTISTPSAEVLRIYPDKLDMLNKPIKNLANPTEPRDAVTKAYVDPTIAWASAFKSALRVQTTSTSADSTIPFGGFVTPISLSITASNPAYILLVASGQISYGQSDVIDVRIARGTTDICFGTAINVVAGAQTWGFNISCIDSVAAGSYTYNLRMKAYATNETLKAGAFLRALIIEAPP